MDSTIRPWHFTKLTRCLTREFNAGYEGELSVVEEMQLELQKFLEENPHLSDKIEQMPNAIFSGRKQPSEGTIGVFFCYALPAWDNVAEDYTYDAGQSRWYLYRLDDGEILENPADIISSITSAPDTPRVCKTEQSTLIDIRSKVASHIKNTYLKRINATVGVNPLLKCWMEINAG